MTSVLLEFSMFPTSQDCRDGSSVSQQVSKIIDAIDKSGVPYQLTPMGTVIEASSMKEALSIVDELLLTTKLPEKSDREIMNKFIKEVLV